MVGQEVVVHFKHWAYNKVGKKKSCERKRGHMSKNLFL